MIEWLVHWMQRKPCDINVEWLFENRNPPSLPKKDNKMYHPWLGLVTEVKDFCFGLFFFFSFGISILFSHIVCLKSKRGAAFWAGFIELNYSPGSPSRGLAQA